MFIEPDRSTFRTPAGCHVCHALIRTRAAPAHCTPLGCGSLTDRLSINIAPRWGAARARTTSL